tara:strand:+ start:115 stop:957 length:843 start_codon:yes stop_codon:yes gene_type:complete
MLKQLAATAAAAALALYLYRRKRVSQPLPPFTVVSPTFYPSLTDVRCQLGIAACREAKRLGFTLLLVDASSPEIKAALTQAGAIVKPQTYKGRKGAALREAIALASAELPADGVVCIQELEKVEMIALWADVLTSIGGSKGASIVVPRRADSQFKASYPIEQYYQENFANLYLDSHARAVGFPSIDWTMGPLCFRAALATHWTKFEGELWDAQIVPMVRAARWHGAVVASHSVPFRLSATMKAEEEGVPKWGDKRLDQLNFLWKHVGGALKETAEGAGAS